MKQWEADLAAYNESEDKKVYDTNRRNERNRISAEAARHASIVKALNGRWSHCQGPPPAMTAEQLQKLRTFLGDGATPGLPGWNGARTPTVFGGIPGTGSRTPFGGGQPR
jgi:hypothetical protein